MSYLGHLLGGSYLSAEMQSVYSTAPADKALIGGVLPLCRDAVSVFYSPGRQGPHWRSLTPLQRCRQCILQPQTTGLLLEESYLSTEMQLVYFTAPADWALVGGVSPVHSDAVGVFYCPLVNWVTINVNGYSLLSQCFGM